MRGLALAVIGSIALYFSDASHLHGWLNDGTVGLVVIVAGAIEQLIKDTTGVSAFGAVRRN